MNQCAPEYGIKHNWYSDSYMSARRNKTKYVDHRAFSGFFLFLLDLNFVPAI